MITSPIPSRRFGGCGTTVSPFQPTSRPMPSSRRSARSATTFEASWMIRWRRSPRPSASGWRGLPSTSCPQTCLPPDRTRSSPPRRVTGTGSPTTCCSHCSTCAPVRTSCAAAAIPCAGSHSSTARGTGVGGGATRRAVATESGSDVTARPTRAHTGHQRTPDRVARRRPTGSSAVARFRTHVLSTTRVGAVDKAADDGGRGADRMWTNRRRACAQRPRAWITRRAPNHNMLRSESPPHHHILWFWG
jgi:hypothetical protein